MAKRQKKPIWEPVKMLKRPNYIISSDLGHLKSFTPSYAKDPVNMYYLMGMEYQRIWNRERDAWEEELFPVVPATKKLIIRTVKRLHLSKKSRRRAAETSPKPTPETFTMKQFQNIPSKIKTTRSGTKLADAQKVQKEADTKSTSQCSRCCCKEREEAAEGKDVHEGPAGDARSEASHHAKSEATHHAKSEASHHSKPALTPRACACPYPEK